MTIKKEGSKILSSNLFPVVGIGASAGGLDAFKKLLTAIPENSGMAYVLVQHLDPHHESLLPELLQKVTTLPVLEIADDIKVEPDHIYIIPSNKMLIANDGILQLSPRPDKTKSERNLPIDVFFTSLAEVHQAHAIGVVLSGTASDGTLGLKAIKDHGGVTFAQDEVSAAYAAMPNSAVHAGVVDFILPPGAMPQKLLEIKGSISRSDEDLQSLPPRDEDVFKQILSLLRIRKGTDFTYYKQTTIRRRILRRMALSKNEEPVDYLSYLRQNKTEQDILYQDMFIPVTSFFRDKKVFDNLCESVFPGIVKNKIPGDPIRVWVAGCSTGEEAYSMAICLKEFLGSAEEQVQIFATDISEPAITKARAGIYKKSELDGVSAGRLQEFFVKTEAGYQVKTEIRDNCVFAVHNFVKDPPFGKIDFVSCRNVLIYLDTYLQKKALGTFHYALRPRPNNSTGQQPKGFLLLGKSETINSVPDLFTSEGRQDKLFMRKDVPGRFMHVASQRSEQSLHEQSANPKSQNMQTDFQKTADEIILSRYTPAGVVVNEAMDIVHFRGATGNYLEQAPGKPSHNLLKMAKSGLAFELRNILHKAKKENKPVLKENIPVHVTVRQKPGSPLVASYSQRTISIEAIPLPNIVEPHYLVLFHDHIDSPGHKTSNGSSLSKKDEKDLRIQQLELELTQTREDMRSITEDQEAVNEELQSANEELLSGSEELQSLNEEMETSKEELLSTNEELTVLNQELISLNEQVNTARDYAEAIIATIREPLLVLDKNLRVKTANDSFYKTFRVNELETVGKLIYNLGNKQWDIPALRTLLEEIIPNKTAFADFEVRHNFPAIGERIILLNAHKMSRANPDEKLILLAFEDLTELRMKTLALQLKEKQSLNIDIANRKEEKVRLEKAVEERTKQLAQVNKELVFQNEEKGKRAAELSIANTELIFQNEEKEKRAAELSIAYAELVFQNEEKRKRAAELILVNKELIFLNEEKETRAAELSIANSELAFQNSEKEKRAAELIVANVELVFQNEEKEKRAAELVLVNKELESFSYVSSHDLQEPLRKIQTFSKLILEKEDLNLSDKGKDYLNRMQGAANRMQILIEDLLTYSQTNSTERKFEVTDLNKIITEVTQEFAESIIEKQATIEASHLGEANIIRFQFRQLFTNLVSNSLKFSIPGKPPHITITSQIERGDKLQAENTELLAGRLSPEKKYCHIRFADNGIGFDPQFKFRIFEVFQRLNAKVEFPGTGIGLAIVKKIIDNHNGSITASGVLTKGTRFDIYIPAY